MSETALLFKFMQRACKMGNLSTTHISLYMAIACLMKKRGNRRISCYVNRRELMYLSKLASTATYHKCIKDLVNADFIKYTPSYHPRLGSLISLIQ